MLRILRHFVHHRRVNASLHTVRPFIQHPTAKIISISRWKPSSSLHKRSLHSLLLRSAPPPPPPPQRHRGLFPAMSLRLSSRTLRILPNLRSFSHAAAALLNGDPPIGDLSAPLEYLPGFPRPDPKHDETILAIPRAKSGKNIAEKERKVGRVPSIVFEQENGQQGGNKRLISVRTNQIRKLVNHLGRSFFLSRLFELEVRSEFSDAVEIIEKVRVLPRKVLEYDLSQYFDFRIWNKLLSWCLTFFHVWTTV